MPTRVTVIYRQACVLAIDKEGIVCAMLQRFAYNNIGTIQYSTVQYLLILILYQGIAGKILIWINRLPWQPMPWQPP